MMTVEIFAAAPTDTTEFSCPANACSPIRRELARRIAAGSQLVFQVHYTPNGSEQLDQSRVGMTFVDPESVKYEVRTASAVNTELRIPPHEANYRVEATSSRLPDIGSPVGAEPAHAPPRKIVPVRSHFTRRRAQDIARRAALRLQLADRLSARRALGASAKARGCTASPTSTIPPTTSTIPTQPKPFAGANRRGTK